ncbi:MAG: hypothetical protein NZ866_00025 [Patescibacteria group bacterium]|nr:hypothetical protein [Patescibacteria group bacterium]
MKSIIAYTLLIYIFLGLFLPFIIYSQGIPDPGVIDDPEVGLIKGDVRDTIVEIFNIVFRVIIWISVALAIIFFAWAGVLIIVQGKFDAGKDKIIWGIIGLIVALVAWAVINLISQFVQRGELGQ